MKRKCFSFESSGHRFIPLDGISGVVVRLYCPCCGRVVPASEAHNSAMWEGVELTATARNEMQLNDRDIEH